MITKAGGWADVERKFGRVLGRVAPRESPPPLHRPGRTSRPARTAGRAGDEPPMVLEPRLPRPVRVGRPRDLGGGRGRPGAAARRGRRGPHGGAGQGPSFPPTALRRRRRPARLPRPTALVPGPARRAAGDRVL